MKKIVWKRIGAYLFDIVIVSLLVSLLSYIPFLNPNRTLYSEKYNELVNLYEQYQNNTISEAEYKEAYIPISYELYQYNVYYVIIDLVIVILYFGIFPYFFHGQTLGKKIMQIKIVSASKKKLSILNYLLRMIVLNNVIITILLLFVIHFMNADNYYTIYQNINLVGYIIMYLNLFLVIVTKEGRGLHDYVANTKVILEEPSKKEQQILELEEKKPKKKS